MDQQEIIRILIADDHATVREGLTALLNPRHHLEVIAEAADGLEAVELYRRYRPDITLMDMRMPRMDGVTAIRAIVSEFPAARIIMLTAFDGEEENARQAGAKGFVLKEASREELLKTIRDVHCAALAA
ncbi:MAG: two component transcriptional regulator, LuxR family [Chthonomonadales bacterium]|nr:two component transcriptional regulator, LuxR family [Chthonomonadales bacterium]